MMNAILELKINSGFQSCNKEKDAKAEISWNQQYPPAETRCQMIDSISVLKCDSHQIQYVHMGLFVITL